MKNSELDQKKARVLNSLKDMENKKADLNLTAKRSFDNLKIKWDTNFKSPITIATGLWVMVANVIHSMGKQYGYKEMNTFMEMVMMTIPRQLTMLDQKPAKVDIRATKNVTKGAWKNVKPTCKKKSCKPKAKK